jgi:hypothetical protein
MTDDRNQRTEGRGQKADFGIRKWEPASFCWSQNDAAASDAEVGISKYEVLFQKQERSPSSDIRPSIFEI